MTTRGRQHLESEGTKMASITAIEVYDIRFPTSEERDGSDAMNKDGDYSGAYVVLTTDEPGLSGYGLTFTIGRGTDLCVRAAQQIAAPLLSWDVDDLSGPGMCRLLNLIKSDSQLRWLGPEKGVVHLATAAVLNAAWDLVARRAGKPLWRLLSEMGCRAASRGLRLQLPQRCADARRGDRHAARNRVDASPAHRRGHPHRVPRVHDLARLARLLRRKAAPALRAGRRRRVHVHQAEGGRPACRRRAAVRDRAHRARGRNAL